MSKDTDFLGLLEAIIQKLAEECFPLEKGSFSENNERIEQTRKEQMRKVWDNAKQARHSFHWMINEKGEDLAEVIRHIETAMERAKEELSISDYRAEALQLHRNEAYKGAPYVDPPEDILQIFVEQIRQRRHFQAKCELRYLSAIREELEGVPFTDPAVLPSLESLFKDPGMMPKFMQALHKAGIIDSGYNWIVPDAKKSAVVGIIDAFGDEGKKWFVYGSMKLRQKVILGHFGQEFKSELRRTNTASEYKNQILTHLSIMDTDVWK